MSKSLFATLLLLSATIPTLAHADDMVDVQLPVLRFMHPSLFWMIARPWPRCLLIRIM
jgi:hypothetical protein